MGGPMMGQGLRTVWPPVMTVSASLARSANPRSISCVTMCRCFGSISRLAASTISMLSQLWMPIA